MGGDQLRTEIVENNAFLVQLETCELIVSAATDCIVRFNDHQFDHLRYYDSERGKLVYAFLGQTGLQKLAEVDIPILNRSSIQQSEVDAYIDSQMSDVESEIDSLGEA